ncbi:MAG: AsmA family protein [Deltaproteobacteria bacterium]|nr:AsmA family protein [Deltaproteobacteria bacterium]
MSTPVKVLLYIVGLITVVIVALVFLVQTQLTPEKIREGLLPLAEKSLHRKVDFGEIEVGLFSGVSVADLSVMNAAENGEFIGVKALKLHYQLWPLLRGQVVIDQVLLEQPRFFITRRSDGSFNFNDLLPSPEINDNKVNNSVPANKKVTVTTLPLNLLVKEVRIKDGEIHFSDRFKSQQSPYRYQLEKLNFSARQITLSNRFPIDLSAVLKGAQVDVSGHYNITGQTGDLLVHLAPLDLIQFAPYYRHLLPAKLGSAELSTNLEIELQSNLLSSKGRIECQQVDLRLDQFPTAALNKASIAADYALSYDFAQKTLDVSTLLVNFNDLKIAAEGEAKLDAEDPYLVATVTLDQLDLRKVMQNIPAALVRDYQKYSLAGIVNGTFHLAGRLSKGIDLFRDAQLSLDAVKVSTQNLRAGIDGNISYADQTLLSENLVVNYGGFESQLKLKAENLFGDVIRGDFTLAAEELNINSLLVSADQRATLPAGNRSGQTVQSAAIQEIKKTELGPFDIPAELTGRVSIDRLLYQQLALENVTADVVLKNNRLAISDLSARLNGGELKAHSSVNLGVQGLAYQGQMALSQPDVVTLISGLVPQAGQSVSGQLQWQNSFSGRGTLPDNLLPALQVKGEFNLLQGVVQGSPLLAQMATFLGDPELKVLSFKSFTGQYDLRDGLAHLKGNLESSKAQLNPQGTVGINGRVNLKLDARLAPEVIDKLGASGSLKQVLTDQNGWGHLPLEIKGTLLHPIVGFDAQALQKQALENAKEKASQKLLEKSVPGVENQETIKQLLDNTLNKLFGN